MNKLNELNNTTKRYVTKQKGKTEVDPFWNAKDIYDVMNKFIEYEDWDSYLIFKFGILLGRRIGDIIMLRWSDFYYENGRRREILSTVEEQKTGKFTNLHISAEVWRSIDIYLEKTGKKICLNTNSVEQYIFQYSGKTKWFNNMSSDIYLPTQTDEYEWLARWCKKYRKDFSDKRLDSIVKSFHKSDYKTIQSYVYEVVELDDIIKHHQDVFRKVLKRAVDDCGITYPVSTHSLRKTFGNWIMKENPFDPNVIYSLQRMFNHSDVQTTMNYIGLSKERDGNYMESHGEFIHKVSNGDFENAIVSNSPVTSIKNDDLRNIMKNMIKTMTESKGNIDGIELFYEVMNEIESKRVNV